MASWVNLGERYRRTITTEMGGGSAWLCCDKPHADEV
jgi:hypothetical protein